MFMAQSDQHNGKAIGLLRGAGSRFATWFYAFIRALRLKTALQGTIHDAKFRVLDHNDATRGAVLDVENAKFWKAMYVVTRSVFPALRLLRYCDANKPAMDKMKHLGHRTTVALEKSVKFLNDEELFKDFGGDDAALRKEAEDVFGVQVQEPEPEEEEEEEEEEAEEAAAEVVEAEDEQR